MCFIFILFHLILESWEKEGERQGEEHQCVVASCMPPTGGLAHNPGMCPDWDLNWRPFGLQAHAQSTELHQPDQMCYKYLLTVMILSSSYLHYNSQ